MLDAFGSSGPKIDDRAVKPTAQTGRRVRRAAAMSLVGAALLGVVSCGERTKVNECNALVAVINKGVEEVQRGTKVPPDAAPGAANLRELAESMDRIAAEAGKVKLTIVELQKFSQQYQAMTKQIATAARQLATAFEKVDEDAMRKAQATMEKAVQGEEPLVEAINKFCRAP